VIPQGRSLAEVDHQSTGAYVSQLVLSIVTLGFAIPSIIISGTGGNPFLGLGLAIAGCVAAVGVIIVIAASGENLVEIEETGGSAAAWRARPLAGLSLLGSGGDSALSLNQPVLMPVFTF
jgi:hypothetical protein